MASIWDQLFGTGQISKASADALNGKTYSEEELMSQANPVPAPTVSTTSAPVAPAVQAAPAGTPTTPFVQSMQQMATPAVNNYLDAIGAQSSAPSTPETADTLVDMNAAQKAQDAAMAQMQAKRQGRMNNLEDAYNMQQEAAMKGAAAGVQQATAESAYLQTVHDEAENMRKQEAARELERQDKLNANFTKLQTAMDELSKMQVDPNRMDPFSADKSTGSKIMSGIALFLGAAPNSSGQNRAVQVMQNAMERDIAAQKANIAAKGQALDAQRGIFSQMKDMFGDERAAAAATRAAYINNAQLKLQQIAAQYKGPQVKANAEALYGQLEAAKQKEMMNFEQATMASQSMQSADELTKSIFKLPKELQGKAMEEKGIIESLNQAKKTLGDSYDTVARVGFAIPLSADKAEREAAKSTIMATVVANWKGPMSDSDLKRVEGLMPTESDTEAQVERKKAQMLALMNTNSKPTPILSGFGLKPKSIEERVKTLKPN